MSALLKRVHGSDSIHEQAEAFAGDPVIDEARRTLSASEDAKRVVGSTRMGRGVDVDGDRGVSLEIDRQRAELSRLLKRAKRDLRTALAAAAEAWEGTSLRQAQRRLETALAEEARLDADLVAARHTVNGGGQARIDAARADADARARSLLDASFTTACLERGAQDPILVIRDLVSRGVLRKMKDREHAKKPLSILFVASNPMDGQRLDLEAEDRSIDREIASSRFRDRIRFESRHGVQPGDLVRLLRSKEPTVLHFSGHGVGGGIALRGDRLDSVWSSPEAIATALAGRGVGLLVLNACFTDERAALLATAVKVVVGTTDVVDDEAARRFSSAFYHSLCSGYRVSEAFRDGRDAVALHGLDDVYRCVGDADWTLVDGASLGPEG